MPRKKKLSGEALQKALEARIYEVASTWAHIAWRDVLKDYGVPPAERMRITRNVAILVAKPVAETALEVARLRASSHGGREGSKTRKAHAKEWQVIAEERARKLLAQGVSERELAGRLAQTVDASADRIRRHLKKAGLK